MKFDYRVFGEKPADGRSLYISMHGGGNAPEALNTQQWQNQIRLYEPAEGVYVARGRLGMIGTCGLNRDWTSSSRR